jgi:hypothetical protein
VVDDFARGQFRIAGEVIGFAGAVEQLVAEQAPVGIENRLATEKAVGLARRGRGNRCFSRCVDFGLQDSGGHECEQGAVEKRVLLSAIHSCLSAQMSDRLRGWLGKKQA